MVIGIGIGLTMQQGKAVPQIITGTAPVLAPLFEEDTLGERVTWGSYSSSAGTIVTPTVRQMKIGESDWAAFDGDVMAEENGTYRVREIVTDSEDNTRTFNSAAQVAQIFVSAPTFVSVPDLSGSPENGELLTVSYTATGNPTPTAAFRWFKNGETLSGVTTSTWMASGLVENDIIKAQVQLTNSEGSTAWTDTNELEVTDGAEIPPSITTPIADQSFTLNQGGGSVAVPINIAGDVLVYTLLDAPAGATISGGNVNIPTGTAGAWNIGVRAQNSLGSVTDTFQTLIGAAIYGTPISMVQPVEGDTLADVVTPGSMATNVGTLNAVVREQRINGGSWATYVGSTALTHPTTVAVRESWSSSVGATRVDTTETFTVVGEPPAPVYPVLRASQDTLISTASTSLSITMPSGRVAGDTLLSEIVIDGTPSPTVSAGWTLVRQNQVGVAYMRLLYRRYPATNDSSDALTITLTGAETLSAKTLAYQGEVSVVSGALGSLNSTNAPALDLGTSAPTLWIDSMSFDGGSSQSADPPAGYTAVGGIVKSGSDTSHAGLIFATRETTAQSEDADVWQNVTNMNNRAVVVTGLRNA